MIHVREFYQNSIGLAQKGYPRIAKAFLNVSESDIMIFFKKNIESAFKVSINLLWKLRPIDVWYQKSKYALSWSIFKQQQ